MERAGPARMLPGPDSIPLIVALGGTLRERSRSRAALTTALDMASLLGAKTELLDLRTLDLPMYRPDASVEDYPGELQAGLARFIAVVRRADAFIWASPTYHGTVSGVFKNALDHMELLDHDDPPYLTGRAVGLIAINDSLPFESMTNSVYELRAWLAPSRVALNADDFDTDLTIKPGRPLRRLERIVEDLLWFASMRASTL